MKKLMLTGLFLLLGVFALSAQEQPTIRIVNNTGHQIYFIFISPSDNDIWGEDLLGEDILESGQTFTYQLPQPLNRVNVYDIRLEDEDEDAYIKTKITMTNNARIVFTIDDLEEED